MTQTRERKKVRIYCDNGTFPVWLKSLVCEKKVEVIYFYYENQTRRISTIASATDLTYGDHFAYGLHIPYGSTPSNKYKKIIKVLGKENRNDARHLDSAYKDHCQCFITADKKHLVKNGKREQLEKCLRIKIYFHDEESVFKKDFHF